MLMVAIVPALAQDDHVCTDDDVMSEPASIRPGVVTARQRSHFHEGSLVKPGCPALTEACRTNAYVVRGDRLFIAPEHAPGFVCASYVNAKGGYTTGWLAADAVQAAPVSTPRFDRWLGRWRSGNSNITIKRGKAKGSLSIDGDSFSKRYMAANTGEFSGEMAPTGNTVAFADKDGESVPIEQADKTSCALSFALVHDVLVVSDSGNCGGAGVYFTGFYSRRR